MGSRRQSREDSQCVPRYQLKTDIVTPEKGSCSKQGPYVVDSCGYCGRNATCLKRLDKGDAISRRNWATQHYEEMKSGAMKST